MARLEILSGKREGDVVELPADGLDIGNRKTAKLSIRDPWISWNHAKIVAEEGRFILEDLGSSNGTYLNGQKITRHPLAPQDEITLGKTRIRFLEGDAQPSPDLPSPTMKLSRSPISGSAPALALDATSDQLASLERERDELRRMKDVLERFLDLSPEERKALVAQGDGPKDATPRASVSTVPDEAAEKARREAMTRVIELEGKLQAAEARAVEAEARLKTSAEAHKKDLAKEKKKHEEELDEARLARTALEKARDEALRKADEAAPKLEALRAEVEAAKKSALDAEARAQKLERDLDAARRSTGAAPADTGGLEALRKERDEWQKKAAETREEIDRISMEQIELEDSLKKRIAELEERLKAASRSS